MSNLWSIYCVTEGAFFTTSINSQCPNNISHSINTGSSVEIFNYTPTGPTGPTILQSGTNEPVYSSVINATGMYFTNRSLTGTISFPYTYSNGKKLILGDNSVKITANGNTGFSYSYNYTNDHSIFIDRNGNVGTLSAIENVGGNPAIAYFDSTNNIKYVRASDSTGSTWGTPVILDASGVGYIPSLAVINGNPAVAYTVTTATGSLLLKYIRATDSTGLSWGVATGLENNCTYTSLLSVSGNPAIAFQGSGSLKYIRANDPNGSTWSISMIADTGSSAGVSSSMKIVGGNPAIAHANSAGVRYTRSSDNIGSSWTSAAVSTGSNFVGLHVISGNPAIAYHLTSTLNYARSSDSTGGVWSYITKITQPAEGVLGQQLSFKDISGYPAISCYDATNADLKYFKSIDNTGGIWYKYSLDTVGTVGQYTSLLSIGGYAAISYYDATRNDLKYIYDRPINKSFSYTVGL